MAWLIEAYNEEALDEAEYMKSLMGPSVLLKSLQLTKEDLEDPKKIKKALEDAKKLPKNIKTRKVIVDTLIRIAKLAPAAFLAGFGLGWFLKDIGFLFVGPVAGAITMADASGDYDRLIEACENRKKKLQKVIDKSEDKKEVSDAKKAIAKLDETIDIVDKARKKSKNKASVYEEQASELTFEFAE